MGKIQANALSRERQILKKIRSGEVTFRSHFRYDHTDWVEIVDFLLTKIQREVMRELYNDLKCQQYQPISMPGFDVWLGAYGYGIKERGFYERQKMLHWLSKGKRPVVAQACISSGFS